MEKSRGMPSVLLVRPHTYIGDKPAICPGRADLVGEMHSIAAAAHALGIPYKPAWLLSDTLNQGSDRTVVVTVTGRRVAVARC